MEKNINLNQNDNIDVGDKDNNIQNFENEQNYSSNNPTNLEFKFYTVMKEIRETNALLRETNALLRILVEYLINEKKDKQNSLEKSQVNAASNKNDA